jgi:hypothetical protein
VPRFEDYDDEDDFEQWRYGPAFREVHPDFNSGAVHPELIYPVEHGPECKGHLQRDYIEEYLWAYVRTPRIHFLGNSELVPVREEFL